MLDCMLVPVFVWNYIPPDVVPYMPWMRIDTAPQAGVDFSPLLKPACIHPSIFTKPYVSWKILHLQSF